MIELKSLVKNIKARCDGQNGRPRSIAELEERVGLTAAYIYKWDKVIPSVYKVYDVAQELDTTVEELLTGCD